ncbi:EFR1 family ferrodoxin [Thermodesulfobacteriota bacterium]
MKGIIIYFSQTGNTKQVARAIHKGIGRLAEQCDIAPLKQFDPRDLDRYDLIGLGSPVWGGVPPNVELFINNMPFLEGKHCFAFSSHGARPERFFPDITRILARRRLIVIGTRGWYCSVNIPQLPKPYFTDGHPDEIDLKEAEDFGKEMFGFSRRITAGETDLIPPPPPPPPPRTSKFSRPQTQMDLKMQKCKYPECRLCMDNCPVNAIDLSISPPILTRKCRHCYFCEMICPEGAIEADYDSDVEKALSKAKHVFVELLDNAEAEGRFRRLVPKEDIGWDTPYYKVYKEHPRYVIPEDD